MAAYRMRRVAFGYALILPAFAVLVVFFAWPLLLAFVSSLQDRAGEFVGVANYARVLQDSRFWNSVRVSVIFTVTITFASGILGLVFALAMLDRPPGYRFLLTVAFVPYISTSVISAMVWLSLVSDPYGLINSVFRGIGLSTIPFLKSPGLALTTLLMVQVWGTVGYNAILFMAGLQTIPKSLYEAARLEGCGYLARLTMITVPLIIPTIVFVVTVSMLYGFINSFILARLITNNGPFEATNVLLSYIFEYAFNRYDLNSANGVTLLSFLLFSGVALVQFRYQNQKYSGIE